MTALARSHVCDGRDLSCLGCAAVARRHALVRAAMTRDDELDDLTRVRIWNALEPRLARPAAARRRLTRFAVGFGAFAAAAAVAIVLVLALRDDPARTLAVADGATLSSPIGPHTRARLVGPAELDIVRTGPATAIRLRRGTFVADFAGGPDRSLRIEAPGATIEIVGTLFAVEARATASCISVAHGTVRVTTRSSPQVTLVRTGQTFCSDTGARRIAPQIEQLLARHERALTAEASSPPASPSVARASSLARSPTPIAPQPTSPSSTSPAPASSQPRSPRTMSPQPTSPQPTSPQPTSPQPTSPQPTSPQPTSPQPTSPRSTASSTTSTPSTAPPTSSMSSPHPPASSAPEAPSIPPIARPTADELYRAAERALANRDTAAADRALDQLVTEYPTSPLGEQALYERARMAHQKRAWASARRHLDRLLALPKPRLAEPARYLVCRIAVEAGDGEATTCLLEYRKAYPRSPHDLDVLGLLVEREHARGGCRAAAAQIDELVRAHPKSELARAWQARCEAKR